MAKIVSFNKAVKKIQGILQEEISESKVDLAVTCEEGVNKLSWVYHGRLKYIFLNLDGTYERVSFRDAEYRLAMLVCFPREASVREVRYDGKKKIRLTRTEDDVLLEEF